METHQPEVQQLVQQIIELSEQLLELVDIEETESELLIAKTEQRSLLIRSLFSDYDKTLLIVHTQGLQQIQILDQQLLKASQDQKSKAGQAIRKVQNGKQAIAAYQRR